MFWSPGNVRLHTLIKNFSISLLQAELQTHIFPTLNLLFNQKFSFKQRTWILPVISHLQSLYSLAQTLRGRSSTRSAAVQGACWRGEAVCHFSFYCLRHVNVIELQQRKIRAKQQRWITSYTVCIPPVYLSFCLEFSFGRMV